MSVIVTSPHAVCLGCVGFGRVGLGRLDELFDVEAVARAMEVQIVVLGAIGSYEKVVVGCGQPENCGGLVKMELSARPKIATHEDLNVDQQLAWARFWPEFTSAFPKLR